MTSRTLRPEQLVLFAGVAALIFFFALPAQASHPSHAQMIVLGQSEEEPKKKGETDEETSESTEEEDDEPDC